MSKSNPQYPRQRQQEQKRTLSTTTSILLLLLLLVSPYIISSVSAACTSPAVRPEWGELSETQKQALITAINSLKSRTCLSTIPVNDPTKLCYDNFVQIHWNAATFAHGNSLFWPWHRLFLLRFEQALQTIDPSVVVPYFDTSAVAQAPEKAEIFGTNYFGGTGTGSSNCVTTGKFAGWQATVPTKHCLSRNFDGSDSSTMGALYGPDATFSTMQDTDYDTVRQAYESGPHGRVHNGIGGDMAQMYSTNDPIFWVHHANVDRLWASWQSCPNFATKYDGGSSSQTLTPFSLTVADMYSTVSGNNGLCYTYTTPSTNRAISACPVTYTTTKVVFSAATTTSSTRARTTTAVTTTTTTTTAAAAAATTIAETGHEYWLQFAIAKLIPNGATNLHVARRDWDYAETASNVTLPLDSAVTETTTSTTVATKTGTALYAAQTLEPAKANETTTTTTSTTAKSTALNTLLGHLKFNATITSAGSTITPSPTRNATSFPSATVSVSTKIKTVPGTNVTIPIPYVNNTVALTDFSPRLYGVSVPEKYCVDTAANFSGMLPTYIAPTDNKVVIVPADDRTDMYHLRHPKQLPSAWLKMNKMDVYAVRKLEVQTYYLIDQINSLDEYVPDDALINQCGSDSDDDEETKKTRLLNRGVLARRADFVKSNL